MSIGGSSFKRPLDVEIEVPQKIPVQHFQTLDQTIYFYHLHETKSSNVQTKCMHSLAGSTSTNRVVQLGMVQVVHESLFRRSSLWKVVQNQNIHHFLVFIVTAIDEGPSSLGRSCLTMRTLSTLHSKVPAQQQAASVQSTLTYQLQSRMTNKRLGAIYSHSTLLDIIV